jgi:hypothetical protein
MDLLKQLEIPGVNWDEFGESLKNKVIEYECDATLKHIKPLRNYKISIRLTSDWQRLNDAFIEININNKNYQINNTNTFLNMEKIGIIKNHEYELTDWVEVDEKNKISYRGRHTFLIIEYDGDEKKDNYISCEKIIFLVEQQNFTSSTKFVFINGYSPIDFINMTYENMLVLRYDKKMLDDIWNKKYEKHRPNNLAIIPIDHKGNNTEYDIKFLPSYDNDINNLESVKYYNLR